MNFVTFFSKATGNEPYGWQSRLAENPTCQSLLIDIPTGLGKTAGVVMAWLWNRLNVEDGQIPTWPRRLVYCLPMRTLVEQTEGEVENWIQNLWKARDTLCLSKTAIEELCWLSGNGENVKAHSPIILMGGEYLSKEKSEWDLHPERPAILIGTQDMLLSRALNRGYGMSRYRWPMHFALLNNDCLWIMDEVQLMGAGIQTARQLEAFRRDECDVHNPTGLSSYGPTYTWYCSATASEKANKASCLPYELDSCEAAWETLKKLGGNASPANLSSIRSEIADSIQPLPYSLLKHELLDFFNTDANLSLGYTDVSPFVRGQDEHTDVYVLWREWEKESDPNQHFRGDIQQGDRLDALVIAGIELPETTLDIDCRKMGRNANGSESYTKGVLRLLEHYGPFRLAYWETLFRAADCRASIQANSTPPQKQ